VHRREGARRPRTVAGRGHRGRDGGDWEWRGGERMRGGRGMCGSKRGMRQLGFDAHFVYILEPCVGCVG